MIHHNSITKPNRRLTTAAKREIVSVLMYFNKNHSLSEVKYLPKSFKLSRMEAVFGAEFNNKIFNESSREKPTDYYYQTNENRCFDIHGYDYFIDLTNLYSQNQSPMTMGPMKVSYSNEDRILKIMMSGKEVYHKNINDLALKMLTKNNPHTKPIRKKLEYMDQKGNIKIFYVFKQINGSEDMLSGEVTLNNFELYLFIKVK